MLRSARNGDQATFGSSAWVLDGYTNEWCAQYPLAVYSVLSLFSEVVETYTLSLSEAVILYLLEVGYASSLRRHPAQILKE